MGFNRKQGSDYKSVILGRANYKEFFYSFFVDGFDGNYCQFFLLIMSL